MLINTFIDREQVIKDKEAALKLLNDIAACFERAKAIRIEWDNETDFNQIQALKVEIDTILRLKSEFNAILKMDDEL